MNQIQTTTPNSFENNDVKDTKTIPLKPDFDIDKLSLNGLGEHLKELSKFSDFPVDALPEQLQSIVRETNECLNFPIDFIAASLLSAASTAIGNTYHLKWKWTEHAALFMVLVGNPGTNKTHPPNFAYAPLVEKDKEYYKQYKEKDKEFEVLNSAFLKSKSNDLEAPIKPTLKKHIVSDCTIEALANVHQNNTRGICSHNDEAAGWINNMGRYNNGSDLQQWLQMWSGQPIVIDRKMSKPVRIERPFVNVIGTIQPAVIEEMAKDNKNKNGFTDRLLFVNPKGLRRSGWANKELDPSTKESWFRIINRLLSLEFSYDEAGNEISNNVWYTKEAEQVLREWQEENINEDAEYGSEIRDGISAKIETYTLRFSLILQLLKWACDEADKRPIEASTVKDAIRIAKYFKRTALEIAEYINGKSSLEKLPEIKRNIYKLLPAEFTTEQGLAVAMEYSMPERTFKHWLSSDRSLFGHKKHGEYKKLIA
jgi:hypothetical protein